MEKIVILTGAGISAESGLGTFRDEGGLWAQYRIEDVATPEAFARNPQLVQDFYNQRRSQAEAAQPNPAHDALARLEREWSGDVHIVTQNVDSLHEKAGSRSVLHLHGTLAGALCNSCGHRWHAPMSMKENETCPRCAAPAARPDVVWFGEMPYHMEEIFDLLSCADLFAAIGTSGQVYPAAAFVQEAAASGAETIEFNLDASAVASDFDDVQLGKASALIPAWVDRLLGKPA